MNKIIFAIIIACYLHIPQLSFSQWNLSNTSGATIRSIYFDKNEGLAGGDYDSIYLSHDYGKTWNSKHCNFHSNSGTYYFNIDGIFKNQDTILVLDRLFGIFRSYNNGDSWKNVNIDGNYQGNYNGAAITSSKQINIASRTGTIFQLSSQNDTIWEQQKTGVSDDLTSIYFIDKMNGYIGGKNGVLRKSVNGGKSWTACNLRTSVNINSIFFINKNIGWAVGENQSIFKTIDGGLSWTYSSSAGGTNYHSVFFIDENLGYIVGDYGSILKTTIGGAVATDWKEENSGTFETLYSVYFQDKDHGWAVGNGGNILTYNPSVTSTLFSLQIQKSVTISPNPMITSSILSFNLDAPQKIQISLINVIGQNSRIIEGNFPEGNNSITIEKNNLQSGTYILKFQGEKEIFYKKIVIE